ncbi:MAG TPA: ABC transporter permease [Rubrivivax sp.]|nr:ABC transporter permease [Rubrivivax sp.]HPO18182.1 ABC transporter permease [Rubrivivax sp.]
MNRLRRVLALVRKEMRQLLRDRSNLALGIVLPGLLTLLFGYGLSMDVQHAPVAVVLQDTSPGARDAASGLALSPYLAPRWVDSMPAAEALMRNAEVLAIVNIPGDFSARLAGGDAVVQLLLHGSDAATARTVQSYVAGAFAQAAARRADAAAHRGASAAAGAVQLQPRLWFNSANTSSWYLVPGLIVIIITLVGAFLTSLVVAREWERGTLEALFVTPARPAEILFAKLVPYFAVGMLGFLMCLAAARWLFGVPLQGSLALLVAVSVLYLLVALGIGLFISSVTRNQFVASQVALLTSFLPALMLSGFLFDLRNVPAPVWVVGNLLPATHFMTVVKTLFLAGNVPSLVLPEAALLVGYLLLFFAAALAVTKKRLD